MVSNMCPSDLRLQIHIKVSAVRRGLRVTGIRSVIPEQHVIPCVTFSAPPLRTFIQFIVFFSFFMI